MGKFKKLLAICIPVVAIALCLAIFWPSIAGIIAGFPSNNGGDDGVHGACIDGGDHVYKANMLLSTCTEVGYTQHRCEKCGYIYISDFAEAEGHRYGEATVTTEATCTEDGEQKSVCLDCGAEYTSSVSKLGHSYTVYDTEKEDGTPLQ